MILWIFFFFFCLTYIIFMSMHHSLFFWTGWNGRNVFQLHYWIFQLTTNYGLHHIFFKNVLASDAINLSDIVNKLLFFCCRAWMWMPLRKNSTPLKLILSTLSSYSVKMYWNSILDSMQWSAMGGWVGSILCIVKNWQWMQSMRSMAENPGFFLGPKELRH